MSTLEILGEVDEERRRQERLRLQGKFLYTCATVPGLDDPERLAVLAEEFGEVAREVTEIVIAQHKQTATDDPTWRQQVQACRRRLRKELIEVAAVAVAFVEGIDREQG